MNNIISTTNDERRTTNDERRTTNDERRTTNDERRTTSLHDFLEWDVITWSRLTDVITDSGISLQGRSVLELGARNGGLSLFYALNGADVLCSDITPSFPSQKAIALHKKYNLTGKITYANINALDIPSDYHGKFDIVTFKSVLGGIGSGNPENERLAVANITRCLKPGGYVIFAENMRASGLHEFFRKHFRTYRWHYQTEENIRSLFADKFTLIHKSYCGFSACFGVNEKMREVLGRLDKLIFNYIVPERWKYLGVFIFRLKAAQ